MLARIRNHCNCCQQSARLPSVRASVCGRKSSHRRCKLTPGSLSSAAMQLSLDQCASSSEADWLKRQQPETLHRHLLARDAIGLDAQLDVGGAISQRCRFVQRSPFNQATRIVCMCVCGGGEGEGGFDCIPPYIPPIQFICKSNNLSFIQCSSGKLLLLWDSLARWP